MRLFCTGGPYESILKEHRPHFLEEGRWSNAEDWYLRSSEEKLLTKILMMS